MLVLPIRRLLLGLVPATAVALLFLAGTADAQKRCCFKLHVEMAGSSTSTWPPPPADQIGEDSVNWHWIERMILVYQEQGAGSPDLRLARLGGRDVRPSSGYSRTTSSSVQIKGVNGYYPAADPGACGFRETVAREGSAPSLQPRSVADAGAQAKWPNARYFLSAGSAQATEDDGCLYGRSLFYLGLGPKEACNGSFGFSLPAPGRAWFRRGKGEIQKDVVCKGGHPAAPPNINNTESTFASGLVVLTWFPPEKLKSKADRLKELHKKLAQDGVG
ncbi:MAG TPA: hypothetical protein VHF50_06735 [Solirubrobacterales bacterium]|nr:hypothetical protein [Solirubrobacterales bacterium]